MDANYGIRMMQKLPIKSDIHGNKLNLFLTFVSIGQRIMHDEPSDVWTRLVYPPTDAHGWDLCLRQVQDMYSQKK